MPRTRKPAERQDGSVEIDLSKPPTEAERKIEKPLPDYAGTKLSTGQVDPALKTIEPPPKKVEPPPDDEPDLAQQVKALKAAEESAKRRAEQAEAARQQEAQRANQLQQRSAAETDQARYDSVVNALAATQAEADQLQGEYEFALAQQDHHRAAEVHRKMVKTETRLSQLEDGKQEFERVFEERRRAPPPPPVQQQPANIEAILSQMPALNNDERDWLRQHPDAITDRRQMQRLEVAYLDAEKRGIARGTREYFRFFEDRLGYDLSDPDPEYDDQEDEMEPEPPRRVAAPVSREAPGASRRTVESGKVVLSPAQREAARISHTDEFTYAQNVAKLREMKKKGYYQETG